MADVFISYAREDRAQAERIASGLQAMGLDPFWDSEIPPGQTWADYIEAKLGACKAVIVLWSQYSTKSQWVREEARMGRDKSKLIPALLDASPAPFGFGEVQAADLSTWRGEPNHSEWMRFSQAVYAAARDGAAAPQPAPRPFTPTPAFTAHGDQASLSPLGYIQKCLRLYADGKGRARRAEYWWWSAFFMAVSIAAYVLDGAAFGFDAYTGMPTNRAFSTIVFIAFLAPAIAVTSRRFHDVGLSGWFVAAAFGAYLIGVLMMSAFISGGDVIVGATVLALFVVAIIPSRPGDNAYGPSPKMQGAPHPAV